jgi:hypothetical protein
MSRELTDFTYPVHLLDTKISLESGNWKVRVLNLPSASTSPYCGVIPDVTPFRRSETHIHSGSPQKRKWYPLSG